MFRSTAPLRARGIGSRRSAGVEPSEGTMLDQLKDLGAEGHPVFYIATAQTFEDKMFQHIRKVCLSRGLKQGEESTYRNLVLTYTEQGPEWVSIRQPLDDGENRMILMNADQENGACYAISGTDRAWMGMVMFGLVPRGQA